jgi:hypothetical protein
MRCSWKATIALLLVALPMLACSLTPVTPTVTLPPPTDIPPTLPPSPEPTSTATPTPAPDDCPPLASVPLPDRPADLIDYPYVIQQYLSAGAGPDALRAMLEAWGALDDLVTADLKGNENDELVLVVHDPNSDFMFPSAGLFIFGCRAGAYEILAQDIPPDLGINLLQVSDATDDDRSEVAYTRVACGAHTCFETLEILGWDTAGFYSLMRDVLEMPYPTYVITPGQIEARYGGIGSAGAEPQRFYTDIWVWDGRAFAFSERRYAPAVYRYHVLLEGERALETGDYGEALPLFQRAIDDDSLAEWSEVSGMIDPAEEQALLVAFSRYRILLIHLLMGRPEESEAAYEHLLDDYPEGVPGHEASLVAETFWVAYEAEERVADGCAAVVEEAQVESPLLNFFNGTYGYANPWWEPPDLCPFDG